jgi:uncharacterized protein (DUF433 family)
MELESYFDVLSEDDIRIRGTRVGIETVLLDFLEGSSPEEIAVRYGSLSLEQVYATITYYLRNRGKVDDYLHQCQKDTDDAVQQQEARPSDIVRRLRELKQAPSATGRAVS